MESNQRLASTAWLDHGGDLTAARRRFPGAPEPFIDLSTGINPSSYPLLAIATEAFARLPERAAIERLATAAARVYAAPSAACVVPAPGTQILLPLVARLIPPGRAAILGPTYSEHARAAALADHAISEVTDTGRLCDADLAIIVNPNNPDGRIVPRGALLALADELGPRGGLLVVDEAFMDVGPPGASLAADVERSNLVVLRSFGKFFGLPGLRLGFALAGKRYATTIRALLGPWAVAGPAIAVGEAALADRAWADAMRASLAAAAGKLDEVLLAAGLKLVGGTSLFRLVETPRAAELFDALGRSGILVRRFVEQPTWLRFGLPGSDAAWDRLATAVAVLNA